MSSPGNQPTLTLKLERDSSPFTPRSPKNFPLQVDISSEDEYEKFLADLCNAEEELGLALPPGLATSQGSGQVKARKTRSKGRKIEGHRASWSVYQSLQCIIRERKNINTTSCLNDCRLPQKTHPFDCPIHKAPHPTDALSAVKFLMANHTGAAHAGGPVLPNFFIISPCQAPIPLASAVPAATARQVFRVADLDLCGGKVTSSGYFSHLVRATNSAAVATQEVFVPRADPQLSERPERGLRTVGGACSKNGAKRCWRLRAMRARRDGRGRRGTNEEQRRTARKAKRLGRRRRRAATTKRAGRSAEEVVRTSGRSCDEVVSPTSGGDEYVGAVATSGARGAEVARGRRVARKRRAQRRDQRGGVADNEDRAATSTWRSGDEVEDDERSGNEVRRDERGGDEVVRGGDEVVRGRRAGAAARPERRRRRQRRSAATSRWAQRRGGGGRRAQRQRGGARAEGGRSGGTSAVAMRWCAVATGWMNLNFLRAHSTCNRLKFLRTQAQLISRVPPRKVSISSHPCT
ncbi:hypothetical protein C8R47DRAFT_1076145 [Mycena vitilis]|nr:hypothetical protein C8R47DRAFT_1076145 [Mycena vitilis]